jgi:hypothetical protein
VPLLRLRVELLTRMAVLAASASCCCFLATRRRLSGILSTHRTGAFPFAGRTDMGLSFAFLLCRSPLSFLMLGPVQIALIAAAAFVL